MPPVGDWQKWHITEIGIITRVGDCDQNNVDNVAIGPIVVPRDMAGAFTVPVAIFKM